MPQIARPAHTSTARGPRPKTTVVASLGALDARVGALGELDARVRAVHPLPVYGASVQSRNAFHPSLDSREQPTELSAHGVQARARAVDAVAHEATDRHLTVVDSCGLPV